MAEQRLQLLKKRLLKNEDLLAKYRTTMQEYIVKGHAQKVPKEELHLKEQSSGDTPTETGEGKDSF